MTLDNLLADMEGGEKFEFMDTVMMKAKAKKREQQKKLNELFVSTYPFISEGNLWTQPREPIQEFSDVQIIKIFPQ